MTEERVSMNDGGGVDAGAPTVAPARRRSILPLLILALLAFALGAVAARSPPLAVAATGGARHAITEEALEVFGHVPVAAVLGAGRAGGRFHGDLDVDHCRGDPLDDCGKARWQAAHGAHGKEGEELRLDRIAAKTIADGYRLQTLIHEVVQSAPFVNQPRQKTASANPPKNGIKTTR